MHQQGKRGNASELEDLIKRYVPQSNQSTLVAIGRRF
jgi:hypothetical protein